MSIENRGNFYKILFLLLFMQHQIRGTVLPILDVQLEAGEKMFTEAGGMAWKSPNISMESSTRGGFMKGFNRMLSGESLFMTTYTCDSAQGIISFCTEFPGKIIPLDLKEGESMMAQRDSFLAAENSVSMKSEMVKKMSAGFFGGEGFFLQKITGPGKAFLKMAGEITEYTLEEGQVLQVDPGYIGGFEPTVQYSVDRIKGMKNIMFSGEGFFLATLSGPGKVYLQSMPMHKLAARLSRYLPKK